MSTIIKGKKVEYEERFYFCANSNEDECEFETGELLDDNLENAREAYRMKVSYVISHTQVLTDLSTLPSNYKTADLDRLIRRYIKEGVDVSTLRSHILTHQELHRIYYFVHLKQMQDVNERMEFIHNNLLFSDWWHTDQLIGFVADLDFDKAFAYAKDYVVNEDAFIRRWGYVLFISKLGRDRAKELLALTHDDAHYTVQMAQAWLIAELTVFEPDYVFAWLKECGLQYNITGKAIQKICDSFRISKEWKERFKSLREGLRGQE